MGVAEIEMLLMLAERVVSFTAILKRARDEGRIVSDAEMEAFVAADEDSIKRAKEAYARAKAEGR